MNINSTKGSFDLLIYFIFVALFLVFVYYVTNLIGLKAKKTFNGKNMKVIEKLSLSIDKSLFLVSISNIYYVLYIDKQGCTKIDKLEDIDIKEIKSSEPNQNKDVFSKLLIDKIQNYKKDKGE